MEQKVGLRIREHDRGHLRRDVQSERQGTVFRCPEGCATDEPGRHVVLTTPIANVKRMPGVAAYDHLKSRISVDLCGHDGYDTVALLVAGCWQFVPAICV